MMDYLRDGSRQRDCELIAEAQRDLLLVPNPESFAQHESLLRDLPQSTTGCDDDLTLLYRMSL